MDLIYTNREHQDIGVLKNPQLDLAFGRSENNFECKIPYSDAYCEKGSLIYAEGTEYGGIVDSIGIDTRGGVRSVTYSGRTWHGILGSKVILPLQKGEATGGGKKLPEGCTRLEYIVSTGTQYLDTKFAPNQDTRVVADVQCIGTGLYYLFGTRAANYTNRYSVLVASGSFRSDYATGEMSFSGLDIGARYTIDKDKNVCMVGSNIVTNASATFQSALSLYLFANNHGGTAEYFGGIKLYACQIYDNGTLSRDYVPILDPSGVACMYDYVNGEYCYNAGTGSFIPGYKLPEGYTEREYIESTGTQHLDTGFKPNQNSRIVLDYQNTGTSFAGLAGAQSAVNTSSLLFFLNSSTIYPQYGNSTLETYKISKDTSGRMVYDLSASGAIVGDSKVSVSAASFSANCTVTLFTINIAGTPDSRKVSGRMYSTNLYSSTTPTRDYVPVTDANGVACAFDRIGNKTYYNAGSGSFTAGPAVAGSGSTGGSSGGISYSENVNVEGETASGESLVDRYLILSGDANACIEYVLNRIGLPSALFVPVTEESGVMVEKYQFARYVDAYTGLCDMLASVGMRLNIVHENGFVTLSAVAAIDYSQTQEFEAALIPYETKKYLNKPNHLVCLGSGELENRMVVHLYMDADGNISETPTFSALDDYTAVYDYSNAASGEDVTEEEQRQELIASGTERFKELQTPDTIDIDFDITEDAYYIGDIIGTYDQETGLFVSALIYKKIMTFKNGRVNVYYNEG